MPCPAPLWSAQDPYAYTESLRQAVRPALSQLKLQSIGHRNRSGVVFITHSLGGLVTKAMLVESSGDPEHKSLLETTRGVAFLATPHSGAALANVFCALPSMLNKVSTVSKPVAWLAGMPLIASVAGAAAAFANWYAQPSNQVQWLQKADPSVRLLAESYREIALQRRISTRAFYETQPFHGLKPKLTAWVVDAR